MAPASVNVKDDPPVRRKTRITCALIPACEIGPRHRQPCMDLFPLVVAEELQQPRAEVPRRAHQPVLRVSGGQHEVSDFVRYDESAASNSVVPQHTSAMLPSSMGWLARLDARSKTWTTLFRWSYVALKLLLLTVVIHFLRVIYERNGLGIGALAVVVVAVVYVLLYGQWAPPDSSQPR